MNAPSASTKVVGAAGHCSPRSEIPAAISVPGANGAAGTIDVNGTFRSLPSAAGLVQAVSRPAPLGRSRKPATPLAPRPKIAVAGGVSPNVLNASTQPRWVALRHVGIWRNEPPRSEPLRTVTSPPSSTADTSRRRSAGLASIFLRMSRCR